MGILNGFFSEDLAIDLGTVNTIVYAPTQGVVLNEPSVLALNKYSGEVLSVGSQALKLLGREPNDTEVYRPIRRGAIDNFEISQKFLRALISRVQHNDHPRRSHLVIDIGGGTSNVAILASGGVVSSVSVPAAGNAMDEAIRDYLRLRYAVQIGERTAELVKRELGSASESKANSSDREL